jgi:HEAT repeat protein
MTGLEKFDVLPAQLHQISDQLNIALSKEVETGQLSSDEANELTRQLGYLAATMTKAGQTEIDKLAAGARLFGKERKQKATEFWRQAKQLNVIEEEDYNIRFREPSIQQYFGYTYCLAHPLTLWLLSVMAQPSFKEISQLKAQKDNTVVSTLLNWLNYYAHSEVRSQAAYVLGLIGDKSVAEALIAAFDDEYEDVRLAAAKALAMMADERLIVTLGDVLNRTGWPRRHWAVKALGQIKNEQAFEALFVALKNSNDQIRTWTVEALGEVDDSRARQAVFQALSDSSSGVCTSAWKAVRQIDNRQKKKALIEYITSEVGDEKADAVITVLKKSDRELVEFLIQTLNQNPSPVVRGKAAIALGIIGDKAAIEPLLNALAKDNYQNVTCHTMEALAQLGGTRAIPA